MERLDELSKLLAMSVSRRESMRSIGVALAGAALSTLGLDTAWAATDPCTAFCRRCAKAKRNQCLVACRACKGNTNRLCGSCGNYVCCSTSATCCSGTCRDLISDRNNCGACGYVCPEGNMCVDGFCAECNSGFIPCGGICVDPTSDPYNCGACGNVCPAGKTCSNGSCIECNFPFIPCDGVCVDPTSDRNNCGGCGNQCSSTEACISGFCESGG